MVMARISGQDCSNTSASATSLTATFPGGGAPAGVLLVACASIDTALSAVTRPSGSTDIVDPTDQFAANPCLFAVGKIAVGGETGMTFTHNQAATGMNVWASQYTNPLSPLVVDKKATHGADGSLHSSWASGTTVATTQANELALAVCGPAGTTSAQSVDTGSLIAIIGGGVLLVAEKILSATGTQAITFSWTTGRFVTAGIGTVKAAAAAAGSARPGARVL